MLKLKRIFLLYIITSLCTDIVAIAQNVPQAGGQAGRGGTGMTTAAQRPGRTSRFASIAEIEKQIANLRSAIQKAPTADPCIPQLQGDALTTFRNQYTKESNSVNANCNSNRR